MTSPIRTDPPEHKRGLFDLLSSQRRFIYLMTALLSAGGIWAALRIPSAIYPELVFPRVIVVAEGSSLDARQSSRRVNRYTVGFVIAPLSNGVEAFQ